MCSNGQRGVDLSRLKGKHFLYRDTRKQKKDVLNVVVQEMQRVNKEILKLIPFVSHARSIDVCGSMLGKVSFIDYKH